MSELPLKITDHPNFPKVAQYVKYDQDGGGRIRFSLSSKAPPEICQLAVCMRVQCSNCKAVIQPFRERSAPKKRGAPTKNIYLSVSCSPDINKGCCRGAASKRAIEQFETDLCRFLEEYEG